MKLTTRILALLLILVLCFGAVACSPTPGPDDNDPEGGEGNKEQEEPVEFLLVEDKKATFTVVYTKASGNKAKTLAEDLVTILKNVDASDKAAVADTNADAVTEVEVIIGCNPENRPAGLADKASVGTGDWKVELSGTRVLIYGGSDDALQSAYDYFLGSELKLKATSTKLGKSNIKADPASFGKSYRKVESVTVNGEDLNGFTVLYDDLASNSTEQMNAAKELASTFASYAGVALNIESVSNSKATERLIKFVKTEEAGETGFRIRPDGKNLLVEYKYDNTFARSVKEFCEEKLSDFKGTVAMDGNTVYSFPGNCIYYEEYGAAGDGETNDFMAIYNTHVEANRNGQTVCADDDATYYICEQKSNLEIPIKTNVNWGKAHFIIDDIKLPGGQRTLDVFRVLPDYEAKTYSKAELMALNNGAELAIHPGDKTIAIADTSLFRGDLNMIVPYYNGQRIFIRYGINQNAGQPTNEILMVDKDGNIGEDTFVEFNYPTVDQMWVLRVDETPITLDGGIFTTWANGADRTYNYYYRGISTQRSNTTIQNLEHYVEKEYANGAPYNGFLDVNHVHNVLMKDCKVTGHKMYRLETDESNTMGSYDLTGNTANKITWDHVTQTNSIINMDYWGIHGTNFCKNFTMKNCSLSRIDAHSGMFNATIVDTVLGSYCNCIGGGKLYMKNVIRSAGPEFIALRLDYGATWHGDAEIIDCKMYGYRRDYGTEREIVQYSTFQLFAGSFVDWDFGYDTWMPTNVKLENFQCGVDSKGTLMLFSLGTENATRNNHENYFAPEKIEINNFQGASFKLTNSLYQDFSGTKVYKDGVLVPNP